MSGFAGIFHGNGKPIELALLQSFADFLIYRGPDAQAIWMDGSRGMAHALLRTTHESLNEQQPASLEKQYWIVADARLDRRAELIAELQRSRRAVRGNLPDSELLLHAYAAWGTQCVDRLRGDFSFALWDAKRKLLFCARDHFGIKPFYYAQLGELLIFSNTLNCIRQHPGVSNELNEAAIGDFLLFGLNYDNATTSFRDIQRLPAAHSLTFSANGLKIKRFWTPPTDGRIRYEKPEEYVEHFQTLFESAVADRLRTDRVGILLSGGLDSSSVAAVAKGVSTKNSGRPTIRGYTQGYESLLPDNDGEYAREVGEFLRIPVKFMAMDHTRLFERWDDPEFSLPEPVDDPLFAGFIDSCRNISADCRVLLSGEGNDNLMDFQMWPHARDLRRRGEWRRLFTDVANYFWVRPFPWRGIRARVRRIAGRDPDMPVFPDWFTEEFLRRGHLKARWKEVWGHPETPSAHPILPRAHASFSLPHWMLMFEQENAGWTPFPLEVCYPFLDLRVVDYLLALPPFPWFFQKMLLRAAMERRIPERVRTRPKTPLQGNPVFEQFRRTGADQLKHMPWSPDADRYIQRSALVPLHGKMSAQQIDGSLRPYCLNIWLQTMQKVRYNKHAEAGNG
ncbi:MAG: asparagine synthetase B family protein [Candidatus Acidiferrales bacterium]